MNTQKYFFRLLSLAALLTGLAVTACVDEPDRYQIADGEPVIHYIRSPYLATADSLITGAYMGNTIAIVGDNLRSIVKMYFNDQPAVLNTSYMTDHTILVNVPNTLPEEPTDKIYMVTSSDKTVEYAFSVLIPKPEIGSMSCEFANPGEEAVLYGDYFLDYDNAPLTITMPGGLPVTDIKSITKTAITFTIPNGAEPGKITVTSKYGSTSSPFSYHEAGSKGAMLFDFDDDGDEALPKGMGWRAGNIRNDGHSLEGGYLYLGKTTVNGDDWKEDEYCFNYWPTEESNLSTLPSVAKLLEATKDVNDLALKFEVQVPSASPWSSLGMQLIFTSLDYVSDSHKTNSYYGNDALPRGVWIPWAQSGSYDTADKWVTVTIPIANFNKTNLSAACDTKFTADLIKGFTIFVYKGGVEGTPSAPEFFIDNIRLVTL